MSSSVQNGQQQRSASRSSSLASRFLSRSKSTEPLTERKTSGGRMLRKKSIDRDDELRRQQASEQAPALPTYTPQPQIATFGGDMAGQREQNRVAALPKGATPSGRTSEEPVDPYARTESMTPSRPLQLCKQRSQHTQQSEASSKTQGSNALQVWHLLVSYLIS